MLNPQFQDQSQNLPSENPNPIVVGLDIGTTKVVAIAGRKNAFGKLEILGFGKADSQGVNHGVVMNIEQCIKSIREAIRLCLESRPGLEISEVYVGIAGQHIKSIQTRGDRVREKPEDIISQEDIELLIRDQRQTYIPAGDRIIEIIPQEFTVDHASSVLNPVGMSGVKLSANFHIITGDKSAIGNIKRCVDVAGLRTRDLVLQPLASAAAVMSEEDLEAGVAIVDIGGGTTDMAVFYDGMLKHTAVIPFAGVNISTDIRNGLGVLKAQAEQLKTQFGNALASEANANTFITIPGLRGLPPKEISARNLAHIIQARMTEVLDYVVYNLKLIGLDKQLYGGIILTGGGAQLQNIIQLTEYVTGLGARIGYPNEHLAGSHAEQLSNPMYATCIGLILRGYHDFEMGSMGFAQKLGMGMPESTEAPTSQAGMLQDASANPEAAQKLELLSEEEQRMQEANLRGNRRKLAFGKLFDGLKNRFMSLFEEEEDEEMR
ncbi:MAG: cell division protein FtsA [Bacteroidetes bacterium]|nr:cell division protein FtsA [Bacteroidota bacterium]